MQGKLFILSGQSGVGKNTILKAIQDATGTRTLTYGTAVKWPGAGTTTLSTGAADIDFLGFICDGSNYFAVGEVLDLS